MGRETTDVVQYRISRLCTKERLMTSMGSFETLGNLGLATTVGAPTPATGLLHVFRVGFSGNLWYDP